MAADKINGQHDDIYYHQSVEDDGRGARINADHKGHSGDEFQIRDNDGNQIDENRRKKVISVNNFGEIGRRYDFMETGIDKGQAENPARRQFEIQLLLTMDGLRLFNRIALRFPARKTVDKNPYIGKPGF